MDFKYDVLKHPNVELSGDGKAKPYIHGEITESIASINLDFNSISRLSNKDLTDEEKQIIDDYELISSEDIDKYFKSLKEGSENE